jgi:hypothetical protein
MRESLIVGSGIAVAVLATVGGGAGSTGIGWSSAFVACAVLAAVPIAVVIAE